MDRITPKLTRRDLDAVYVAWDYGEASRYDDGTFGPPCQVRLVEREGEVWLDIRYMEATKIYAIVPEAAAAAEV